MDFKSRLSGGIGVPEGGGKLLARPEEAAVQNIIKNELSILNIVEDQPDGGGGGTATEVWARFKADATKITGSTTFVLTASRTNEGKYAVTSTKAAATSGGLHLFGVLVSVSSKAGDGGDGLSPFLAFNGYDTVDTDDHVAVGPPLFLSSDTDDLYVLGPNVDDVWIHDTAGWPSAATQVDAEGAVSPSGNYQAGVMSVDGGILWLSAGGGTSIRAYNVNTAVFYNFSDNTDTMAAIFGTDTYVIVRNTTAGEIQKYVPNFGAETLGSATITWTGTDADFPIGSHMAIQDSDGYVWWPRTAHMVRIDPINGGTVNTHAYPQAWTVTCPLSYDRLRNRIIASGSSASPTGGIFAYSGWTASNDSGNWSPALASMSGGAYAIYHDIVSDVFLVSNAGASLLHRFYGPTWQLIDTVLVDDQSPANPQVDVDSTTSNTVVYVTHSTGAYGYVIGNLAGEVKVIRVKYTGDPISGFDGGSGVVSSVLVPLYEITGTTTANVYIFRSVSPPIYADGEFTVKFIYP